MKLRFFILFLLTAFSASAATYYCGPSATGSGTGADFNNRLAFPTGNGGTRGNTYVYIEGSYSGVTFSAANSGTTTVTWRKASAADSAVAGYTSSLHDGVASFGGVNITRQYLVWEGGARTESTGWSSPVGRYQTTATACNANSGNSDDADNATISDIYFGPSYDENPSAATIATYGQTLYFVYNQQNLTFTRCHVFGWTRANYFNYSTGITLDHCDFGPGWGKEAVGFVDADVTDMTIKYCRFYNASQVDPNDGTSGITAEIGGFGNGKTYSNVRIYGCWFYSNKSGGRNAVIALGGLDKTGVANNCVVYNNTFVGIPENSAYGEVTITGTGNVARNNLFYDTLSADVYAGTVSHTVDAGSDPFVNYSSLNLRLSGATTAGTTLSSPYDTDPDGNTRGSDGTFDVGAYEYGGVTYPPVITSSLTSVATNGLAYSYSVTTSNTATTFGATPLPLGVTHSAGVLSGTPTGVVEYSTNTTITATNSAGSDSETLVISVYNGLPPTFTTSPAAATNSEATGVVLTSAATTTYGSLTYQWQSNSVNISGATSANYSKIPAVEAVDSGLYRVIASNSWGSVTSSAVWVSITNATLPPTITASNISGTINVALSYQISATEGPTAYGATGLQAGLSLNAGTGLITGSPAAGTNSVTISATNSYGYDQETVTFSVASVVSTNISVGSRVQVNISPTLRVRDSAALAGSILGEQNYEAQGTVISGPTTADGYVWWEINYDTAPDGWSIEGSGASYWLIVTPGGDTNAPTITVTSHADGLRTNVASLLIAGTASDDEGIAEVTYIWRLPDGTTTIETNATGTTAWSFPVTLPVGSNHFNIWATDTSSNTNTTELGVTYAPNGSAGTVTVGTLRATNLRVGQ